MPKAKELTAKQRDGATVQARLQSDSAGLWSLNEMEQSGGEPDVVGVDSSFGPTVEFPAFTA